MRGRFGIGEGRFGIGAARRWFFGVYLQLHTVSPKSPATSP
jgi:hypothetical protein